MSKKHLYFLPGFCASHQIFELLEFPEDQFEIHHLPWLIPDIPKEAMSVYAGRYKSLIKSEHPTLIGVSFGGMVVQEIAKHVDFEKVVIISSIKLRKELPLFLKILYHTKSYMLFPVAMVSQLEKYSMLMIGKTAKKRLKLYKKYMFIRDQKYIRWGVSQVFEWKQNVAHKNIIHIHGTNDHLFPIKNIKGCIPIKGGSHIMIITKLKAINRILLEELG